MTPLSHYQLILTKQELGVILGLMQLGMDAYKDGDCAFLDELLDAFGSLAAKLHGLTGGVDA